jgi:hypothetical protein
MLFILDKANRLGKDVKQNIVNQEFCLSNFESKLQPTHKLHEYRITKKARDVLGLRMSNMRLPKCHMYPSAIDSTGEKSCGIAWSTNTSGFIP